MGNRLQDLINKIRDNPKGVRFSDLIKLCDAYFGEPRQTSGSHRVYKMPWIGDPRINIKNSRGKAKVYHVKQVVSGH